MRLRCCGHCAEKRSCFSMRLRCYCNCTVVRASLCPKMARVPFAPRSHRVRVPPQIRHKNSFKRQVGQNWHQVGPSWPQGRLKSGKEGQLGPILGQLGAKLGQLWANLGQDPLFFVLILVFFGSSRKTKKTRKSTTVETFIDCWLPGYLSGPTWKHFGTILDTFREQPGSIFAT